VVAQPDKPRLDAATKAITNFFIMNSSLILLLNNA
jgi:hypothetical protein